MRTDHAPADNIPADHAPADHAPASHAPADHRRLGRELKLFATDPLVGAGLPLWLPDGAVIRAELERLAAEEAIRGGCQPVYRRNPRRPDPAGAGPPHPLRRRDRRP